MQLLSSNNENQLKERMNELIGRVILQKTGSELYGVITEDSSMNLKVLLNK